MYAKPSALRRPHHGGYPDAAPLTEQRVREIVREEIDADTVLRSAADAGQAAAMVRAVVHDRLNRGTPRRMTEILDALRDPPIRTTSEGPLA